MHQIMWEREHGPIDWAEYPSAQLTPEQQREAKRTDLEGYLRGCHPIQLRVFIWLSDVAEKCDLVKEFPKHLLRELEVAKRVEQEVLVATQRRAIQQRQAG